MRTLRTLLALLALALLPAAASAQMPHLTNLYRIHPAHLKEFLRAAQFTRTIIVDTSGPTIVGVSYPTVAAAITYINTQTHDASNIWNIVVFQAADSVPVNTPTYVRMWGASQISADTLDLTIQTQGATDVNISGGDDVNVTATDAISLTASGSASLAGSTGVAVSSSAASVQITAAEGSSVGLASGESGGRVNASDDGASMYTDVGNVTLTAVTGNVSVASSLLQIVKQPGAIPACAGGLTDVLTIDTTGDLCLCNGTAWAEVFDGDSAGTGCA